MLDKEGPCLRLLQRESLEDDPSPIIASISAFETTLCVRSIEQQCSLKGAKSDASQRAATKKEGDEIAQEYWKAYGDDKE